MKKNEMTSYDARKKRKYRLDVCLGGSPQDILQETVKYSISSGHSLRCDFDLRMDRPYYCREIGNI